MGVCQSLVKKIKKTEGSFETFECSSVCVLQTQEKTTGQVEGGHSLFPPPLPPPFVGPNRLPKRLARNRACPPRVFANPIPLLLLRLLLLLLLILLLPPSLPRPTNQGQFVLTKKTEVSGGEADLIIFSVIDV